MTSGRSRPTSRRRQLQRIGSSLGLVGLAGCLDGFGTEADPEPNSSEPSTNDSSINDTNETQATGESGREKGSNDTAESDADSEGEVGNDTETESDAGDESESENDSESEVHADYETTDVSVLSADGEALGSVTAAIADTRDLRYLGLSDTESLPEDRGMLFVYESVADRTFVMREMDFGIDIVYADADNTITQIHHAPAPGPDEDGESQRYPGRGQYVLEVNYEWTADRGIEEGDVLEFDL